MATISKKCEQCKAQIPADSVFCPKCGCFLRQRKDKFAVDYAKAEIRIEDKVKRTTFFT